MTEPDYVTVELTTTRDRYLVVIMRYVEYQQGHIQTKISHPMPRVEADATARMWATSRGLEIR